MSRGGNNRGSCPPVSDGALDEAFEAYAASVKESELFSFGPYTDRKRSQAPDALGLVALQCLLLPLFLAGKCTRFLHSQLVGAAMMLLEKLSAKNVKVNKTRFSDLDWCRIVVGQIL
eukprot:7191497-Alexandrium_andersonii.AAC.1